MNILIVREDCTPVTFQAVCVEDAIESLVKIYKDPRYNVGNDDIVFFELPKPLGRTQRSVESIVAPAAINAQFEFGEIK